MEAWQAGAHDISTGRHSLRISATPEEAPALLDEIHRVFIEGAA